MFCNGMLLLPEIKTVPSLALPSRALLAELVCESVGRVGRVDRVGRSGWSGGDGGDGDAGGISLAGQLLVSSPRRSPLTKEKRSWTSAGDPSKSDPRFSMKSFFEMGH